MRLVKLAENLETERGADSQAVAARQMKGSQPAGLGSRIKRVENLEGDGLTTAGIGKGGQYSMKKHPTLSDLKKYLWEKNGPAKHVYSLLGRD